MQLVEAYHLSMLALPLPILPMTWEPKSRPAPIMQAPASTGMATAITKHLVPGPAWSPELGRREPALCLQIEKAQFQLPASQAQPIAQGCRSEQLLAANMQGCKTFHANRGSSQAFFVMLMAYARIKLWQKHGVGVAQECMCLRCKLLDSPSALTEHVSGVWAVSVTQGKDTAAASMVLQKA